jgi:hypothetical protein
MSKILLFIIVFSVTAFSSLAQTKPTLQTSVPSKYTPQLSIGGEFGVPTGDANQIYGKVIGASVKLELPVSTSPFSFVITTGISSFLLKFDYTGVFNNATYVPLEAGGKYYFSKIGYFEGDLGLSSNITGNYSTSKNAFIYSPVIGLSAPTNKHKATVDMGIRYESRVENSGTVNQIALRMAYRFGI